MEVAWHRARTDANHNAWRREQAMAQDMGMHNFKNSKARKRNTCMQSILRIASQLSEAFCPLFFTHKSSQNCRKKNNASLNEVDESAGYNEYA